MESLLVQVLEKTFKPSNFTVYSIIEEDGFVSELYGMFGERYLVDDFEYIVLDLSKKEQNAILYRMSFMTEKIKELKNIIEKSTQEDPLKPKARVCVNKEKCFILIVKLKEFNLQNEIKKVGDKFNNSSPTGDTIVLD